MFIRIRTLVIFAVVAVGFMVVAGAYHWSCVAGAEVATRRHFHGLCNVGVGQPYQELMKRLRHLHETGQTEKLGRALATTDTRSPDMYDVWLSDDYDKYRFSIQEILK